MEKQINLLEKNDLEFDVFINEFKKCLKCCIDNNDYINTDDFKTTIDTLVIYAKEYGIHYGHNHKFKRCDSIYICDTKQDVNIINLHVTFTNLIQGLVSVYKYVSEHKKIFLCWEQLQYENILPHVLISKRWVPGTLTNTKYTWRKYKFEKGSATKREPNYSKHSLPITLVLSTNAHVYPVISSEMLTVLTHEIIFDVSKSKTNKSSLLYIGVVDTNIKTVQHTNIINVCINYSSRYTKKLLNRLIVYLFDLVKK